MKKVIFMLAAAALMASCAKTEMNDPATEGEGTWIQARSKHNGVSAAVTRTPFEGAIASGTNELTARVLTYRANNTPWSDGTMTFTDNATTPVSYTASTADNYKYAAVQTETYTMYGFYPATGWTATPPVDQLTGTIDYTFDGKTDVMAAKITTTPDAATAPTLTFDHLLTKLIVKVVAADAESDTEWETIDNIELLKVGASADVYDKLTYKLDDKTAAFAATTGATPMAFYQMTGATAYTDNAFTTANITVTETEAAYSLVAPIATGTGITLNVTATALSGQRTNIAVPVPALNITSAPASTAGYAFNITLTFDMKGIQAKATVTAWQNGDVVPPVTVQ